MRIKDLKKLHKKKLINFSTLANMTGMNYDTLMQKIKRGTELKVTESEAIEKALKYINKSN